MKTEIDLTGRTFGRLKVIGLAPKTQSATTWLCKCECGKLTTPNAQNLIRGNTKSCGCYRLDRIRTHGQNSPGSSGRTPEYVSWTAMKQRVLNPLKDGFQHYGGRGITICDRWINSFSDFLEDMGKRPSKKHSIDRIDTNLGYSKENCRWATRSEQCLNKRGTVRVEWNGETKTVKEWSEITGMSYVVLINRIRNLKWTAERALTTPVEYRKPRRHG